MKKPRTISTAIMTSTLLMLFKRLMISQWQSKENIEGKEELEKEKNEKNYYFHNLPNELIVKIFSFMSTQDLTKTICLVSHRFRDLAYVSSLYQWTNLPACCVHYKEMNIEMATNLFTRCQKLQKLDFLFHDCVPMAVKALEMCQNMKSLGIHITDGSSIVDLLKAVRESESIKKLHLQGGWDKYMLTNNANCLHRLTALSMHINYGLDGEGIKAIGHHCKNLKKFELLTDIPLEEDEAVKSFLEHVKGTIQQLTLLSTKLSKAYSYSVLAECKQLQQLHMSDVTIEVMHSIPKMPNLTTLTLNNYIRYSPPHNAKSEDYVRAFAHMKLQKLKILELGEKEVNDDVLEAVAVNCPHLNVLRIEQKTKVTNVGVGAVIRNCGKLRRLELSSVMGITRVAFAAVAASPLTRLDAGCIEEEELKAIKMLKPELRIAGLN